MPPGVDSTHPLRWAAGVGATAATLLFWWMLRRSGEGFFDPTFLGGFYDAQVRAWFDGGWGGPPEAFPIERFAVDGEFHMYFGPWPSVLRVPLLAVTDAFDSGLTRASLLLAHVVLFAAIVRLVEQVRWPERSRRAGRRDRMFAALFVFCSGAATSVLFMSAGIYVYDEAILWGAAWSTWSVSVLLSYFAHPDARRLLLVAGVGTVAVLSRPPSAIIVIVVLGAIVVSSFGDVGSRFRRWTGVPSGVVARPAVGHLVALATPVAAYVAVNVVRFGSWRVPFDKQDQIAPDPRRLAVLEQSGSGLADLRQIPTNALQYLRPDAIGFETLFPWVTFGDPPTVVGGVARDPVALSTSVTASSTVMAVLALVGLVAVFRRRSASVMGDDGMSIASLRLPLIGSLLALAPALMVPAAAERYKVDATPTLVVAGWVGVLALSSVVTERRAVGRVATGVGAVVLAVNLWTNVSLATIYQGAYRPLLSPQVRADRIVERLEITEALGLGGRPTVIEVATGDAPSVAAGIGTLATSPDCGEVFVSDGTKWLPVAPEDPEAFCERVR